MGELPPPPPPLQQQPEDEEEGVGVVPPLYSYRSPSCFRFNPTDQELVVYFLSNKISGRRGLKYDPCTIIPTVDIYGPSSPEPWRLCEQLSFPYAPITTPTEFFCFTTRKQLHTQGDRCHRRSGFGTWYASGKEEEIWGGGILVGRRSFFSFKVPDVVTTTGSIHKNQPVTTHWVMYEYRLESRHFQKTVLCRIRNQKKDNDIAHGRWEIPWWEEIPTPSPPPPPSSSTGGCGDSTLMLQQHTSSPGVTFFTSDQPERSHDASSTVGYGDSTLMQQPLTDLDQQHTSSPGVTFTTSDQPEGSHDATTPALPASHCHADQEDDTRDQTFQEMMQLEEWPETFLVGSPPCSSSGQQGIGCGDSTVMHQPDQPFSPHTLPPPPDGVTFTTSDQPEGSHGDQEEDETRDPIIEFLMEGDEEWDQIAQDMKEQELYHLLWS